MLVTLYWTRLEIRGEGIIYVPACCLHNMALPDFHVSTEQSWSSIVCLGFAGMTLPDGISESSIPEYLKVSPPLGGRR